MSVPGIRATVCAISCGYGGAGRDGGVSWTEAFEHALGERRRDGLLVGTGEAAAHGAGVGSVFEGLAQA